MLEMMPWLLKGTEEVTEAKNERRVSEKIKVPFKQCFEEFLYEAGIIESCPRTVKGSALLSEQSHRASRQRGTETQVKQREVRRSNNVERELKTMIVRAIQGRCQL